MIHKAALIFLSTALLLFPSIAQEQKESPVDSITAAELKDHIYFLASDYLEGRYLGSKGFDICPDSATF